MLIETASVPPKRRKRDVDPQIERNAYSITTFGERNNVSSSTIYELHRRGLLKIDKVLGKSIITAEAEADYLKRLRNGELASAKPRGRRAKAAQASA